MNDTFDKKESNRPEDLMDQLPKLLFKRRASPKNRPNSKITIRNETVLHSLIACGFSIFFSTIKRGIFVEESLSEVELKKQKPRKRNNVYCVSIDISIHGTRQNSRSSQIEKSTLFLLFIISLLTHCSQDNRRRKRISPFYLFLLPLSLPTSLYTTHRVIQLMCTSMSVYLFKGSTASAAIPRMENPIIGKWLRWNMDMGNWPVAVE